MKDDGSSAPIRRTADLTGIQESNVSRWLDQISDLRIRLFNSKPKGRGNRSESVAWKLSRGRNANFAAAEENVYGKFLAARERGVLVGPTLISFWMKSAVSSLYNSIESLSFKASSGWRQKLLARFNIGPRRKTNSKEVSVL